MLARLRPSTYGADLRVPQDRFPMLTGANNFHGTNRFDDLWVDNLHVANLLELFVSSLASYASSQSPFTFGTNAPQDFGLLANNSIRQRLTSGGVLIFASAAPSSVFQTILFTDAFTRANVFPLDGWTTQTGASSMQLSSNAAHASGAAGATCAMYPTGDTWDLSAADAQVLISGNGATTDRCGISVFMASGGTSSYDVVFQQNVDQIQIRKRPADSSLGAFASQGHFGTLRAIASAGTTTTWVSALKDGAYVGVGTDSTSPYKVGFAGIRMGVDNPATYATLADDFEHDTTTGPPFSAEDHVWQTSASLWDMLGQTGATKHAQIFSDALQLGFEAPVVFTGLTSAFVSAGTSAYFNTATYGVARLLSAVGTTGLSGVVGLSGAGLTVSAVGNDILLSAGDQPKGLWSFSGLQGGNLAGVSASANFFLTADWFQVHNSSQQTWQGSGLAVSANLTIGPSANGRDVAAAFPAPSWVYLYAISGVSGVAGLWSSAVPSAGPVLPGGYTSYGFATALRINAASALPSAFVRGAWVHPVDVGVWNPLVGGTAAAETRVELSAYIPPVAGLMNMTAFMLGSTNLLGTYLEQGFIRASAGTTSTWHLVPEGYSITGYGPISQLTGLVPNLGQAVYYNAAISAGGNAPGLYAYVQAYTVPNGAQ